MFELLQLVGFTFLILRFFYWVGSALLLNEKKWKLVLLSQCIEGLLLLFIFSQIVGTIHILPMQASLLQVYVGLFLVIVGVGSAFLAKRQLGDSWVYAAVYGVKPKQHLVTTGIYAIVRHPIYVSFAIGYIGIELLAGSWLWIAFLFLFIPAYMQGKKEEKILLKHYGEKYKKYQQNTKMLIPYLW
ncbi:MAG TPA: isoprenylcysteine carboxylmethyltransferase family protein [Candidatus Eisenbacteria bacterium]|nr:isoprenylcysteine carboxylmethyltransferase family protein [Candidatus Eisenbacteria bacterium]